MPRLERRTQGEGGLDRIIYERFFAGVAAGVFVDVGAASPDFLSMSAFCRGLGWRVIAIEPNPVFCEAHRAAGHEALQYACSDHDEDAADFEVVDSHGEPYRAAPSRSSRSPRLRSSPRTRELRPNLDFTQIKVDVRRLDTILVEHPRGRFRWLRGRRSV